MKKTNNKGFSLVELIIVIAIMAILAGAIAPALIRYIDKSRKSNDVSSAKTIKTAVETALGNESVYEYITGYDDFCYIHVTPGASTAGEDKKETTTDKAGSKAVAIKGTYDGEDTINGKAATDIHDIAVKEIAENIGEKAPKLKFRKNAADKDSDDVPTEFVAVVSAKGTVYVFISTVDAKSTEGFKVETDAKTGEVTTTGGFQICPNVCDEYQ